MLRERTRTNAYRLSAGSLLTRPAWDQRGGKGAKAMARCVSKRASLVLGQAERGRGHTVGDVPALLAPVLLLRARLPTELGAAWLFGLHLHTQGSLAGAP